jgi:hypothetical protein
MTDGIVNIRGKEYKTVALRVAEFRSKHPISEGWGIVTEATELNEVIKVKACVISPEGKVVATGHAEERRGSNNINKTNAIENCETGAIGRALSACGFAGEEFASAEEMQRVEEPTPAAPVDVIAEIKKLAETKQVNLDKVTAAYGVTDIHALNADQAKNAIKRLGSK